MLLSQPAMPMNPSSRSACITASTESQMISRLTSEARIPSWPIEIASETVIVPNSSGNPPAACTPALTCSASRRNDMLHGVISFHELAMPICGFSQSSSVSPTARSIARAPARCMPSVTSRERGLMSTGCSELMDRRVVPHASRESGRDLSRQVRQIPPRTGSETIPAQMGG